MVLLLTPTGWVTRRALGQRTDLEKASNSRSPTFVTAHANHTAACFHVQTTRVESDALKMGREPGLKIKQIERNRVPCLQKATFAPLALDLGIPA